MTERERGTRPADLEHIFQDRPDILARLRVIQPHIQKMLAREITAEEVNRLLDELVETDQVYEELFTARPELHNRTPLAALRRNLELEHPLIEPPQENTPSETVPKAA